MAAADEEVKAAAPAAESPAAEEPKAEEAKDADGEKKAKKEKKPKAEGKAKGAKKGGEGKGKGGDGKGKSGSGPFGGGSGYRLNVKNIGKSTEAELKALFEPFGTVTMAQVKVDDNGESRGFGFVVMSTQEEGEKAAADMNGKDIGGKELSVGAATRRDPPEEKGGKGVVKGAGKSKGGLAPQADLQAQQVYMQQIAYMQHAAYMQQMYMQSMYMQQAQQYQAAQQPVVPAEEYEGSLKSLSARNSYGFIVCAQTEALYSRDVYVDESLLPEGAQRGDRLKFTFDLNERGHPKAKTCRRAI
jgi:hypothetical protein